MELPALTQKVVSTAFGQLGRRLWIIFVLFHLVACISSGGSAPVQDRTRPSVPAGVDRHIVQKGDTLYSIAWRYGVDYKELSKRNGVGRNFTIYPGQIIYLDVNRKNVTNRSTSSSSKPSTTTRKPVAKSPAQKPVIHDISQTASGPVEWRWPVQGRIIRTYSPTSGLNKGIDIEGRLGEPVHSAAPGVVVYAGDGLRGYGRLLIIKHDETYLSAYAHNSKLLVKEGEKIKGNQKIAEIGSSGTDTTKLHFEIRRKGQPVDPLKYLPKRK